MKKKYSKLLHLIYKRPVSANIQWREVEAFLVYLGADIIEGKGSAVTIFLDGDVLYQHRPHPEPTMDKGAVAALRNFLKNKGIKP